jgi:hypothetical protein
LVHNVAREEHTRFDFAVAILDRHHPDDGGVFDRRATDTNFMPGYDRRLFRRG